MRLSDARRARQHVKNVDDCVIGDEQRVLFAGLAVEDDELQHRRGFFLDDQSFELHFLRQLGQRGLNAVVDVDRIDVGVAAQLETDGKIVAAVIAARRLHVDHLVDADDLRLDRLRDAGFDIGGGGARISRGDLDLRRHDVRELGDRDPAQRDQPGDRDDQRDDDREPRPVDKDCRDHGLSPGRRGRRARRPGRDHFARASALHALGNDQFAFLEPASHDRGLRR